MLAAQRPLAHHVERLLGQADRPHGVVDPAAAQTGLGDHKRLAFPAEHGVRRDPDVLVVDQGVGALVERLAVQAHVAHDVHARSVGRHQEHRHALVGLTSGLVTAMTIKNAAVLALEEKYFQPLITHSSPS